MGLGLGEEALQNLGNQHYLMPDWQVRQWGRTEGRRAGGHHSIIPYVRNTEADSITQLTLHH